MIMASKKNNPKTYLTHSISHHTNLVNQKIPYTIPQNLVNSINILQKFRRKNP